MAAAPHIVVVEDEGIQRHLLATYLGAQGFRVSGLEHGRELRALLAREVPDLVLLDVHLPDEDAISLARHLRALSPQVGIILVSAAGAAVNRVRGLESGADDYIAKPFEPRELLARVRSVLRRVHLPGEGQAPARVRMGRCMLDLDDRVLVEGAAASARLSAAEFALLAAFAANPHRPLEPGWLVEVAGADSGPIEATLASLRQRIEQDPTSPRTIRTIEGVGYMFVPDAE